MITGNFIKFALLFGGYDCVIAAFKYDENYNAIMKGLQASEICAEATEVMMANLNNFLKPSIFTFLQKLIPKM